MSAEYFVKLPGITGESEKEGHEKEIDVLSWSWGVTQPSSAGSGSGSGAGKAVQQDFHFVKKFDSASPNLAKACAAGDHLKDLTMTARKAGGKQHDYLTITFEEVLVTSYQIGGSDGADVIDQVACSYKKMKIEYKSQTGGGEAGAAKNFSWDIKTGKAQN